MSIESVFFILAFVTALVITFYRFYNVMQLGEVYSIKGSFMLVAVFLVSWLICIQMFFLNAEQYVFLVMFNLINVFLVVNILFFAIEIFYYIREVTDKTIKAYKSKDFVMPMRR